MRTIVNEKYGCKVWEIDDRGKYAEVKISSSRKVKEGDSEDDARIQHNAAKNGYVASYFDFVRFIGHAYNKLKEVKSGDVIYNIDLNITKEPYVDKDGNLQYPKNYKFVVYDFDIVAEEGQNSRPKNLDKAPQVEENNNYVAKAETKVEVEPAKAADECPF